MLDSLYFPLVFLASLVGIGVATVAGLKRHQPGAKPLAIFALAGSVWAVTQGLIVAEQDLNSMVFWTQLSLTVSVAVPVAWLLLVLEFTGKDRWLSRHVVALLLVEPLVFIGLVWTNARHNYIWSSGEPVFIGSLQAFSIEFGLAFWAHQVYVYVLFTAGAIVLMRMLFRSNSLSQWQTTALLGAITMPILANLVFIFGLFPSGFDPTGVASVLAAAIIIVAVFETELHSIAPVTREIGREAVLEELDDVIFILDDSNHIVDVNPAAERLLGESGEDCLGKPLATYYPELSEAVEAIDNRAEFELELDGKVRHYDVRISALSSGYGTLSVKVVSLRDVTDRLERQQRLDVLNRMLRHNIRNQLNLVRGKVELAETDVTDETASKRLVSARETVDEIVEKSNKVGRLSRMLDSEEEGSFNIGAELTGQYETGELSHPGGTVHLEIPEQLYVTGGKSLVAAFEELVTNAIKHNPDTDPAVTISINDQRSDEHHVVIEVADNGPGINQQEWQTISAGRETPLQHSSGVGLWLVNWVVRRAGGTVEFEQRDGIEEQPIASSNGGEIRDGSVGVDPEGEVRDEGGIGTEDSDSVTQASENESLRGTIVRVRLPRGDPSTTPQI